MKQYLRVFRSCRRKQSSQPPFKARDVLNSAVELSESHGGHVDKTRPCAVDLHTDCKALFSFAVSRQLDI